MLNGDGERSSRFGIMEAMNGKGYLKVSAVVIVLVA